MYCRIPRIAGLAFLLLLMWSAWSFSAIADLHSLADSDIALLQKSIQSLPRGERIAFWAERFVGTPYDPDPLGEYVRRRVIVADDRVDCMYHVFRSVELALSATPEEAIAAALQRRFHNSGIVADGHVANYEDRFAYGEDMVFSGKWGHDVTAKFGRLFDVQGSRLNRPLHFLRKGLIPAAIGKFRTGDLVFFVLRHQGVSEELVGHMGVIAVNSSGKHQNADSVFLIHASGMKGRGGRVKKELLSAYSAKMSFAGIVITRFDERLGNERCMQCCLSPV
ncbi:MAG TPA: hypothetical protein VK445_03565 [Dissulfurispiraceae bacterium]|nr:hypothetical protein [Dissulfurispiraceae bacterium]